jgi:hypothetical protein
MPAFKKNRWKIATIGLLAVLAVGVSLPQASAHVTTSLVHDVQHILGAIRDLEKRFYLTTNEVQGSQALTSCAAGFHMASLWEVFDTTDLEYDTSLGFTQADSGFGPPSGSRGWIRTGFEADTSFSVVGRGNCAAWTSTSGTDYGTIVRLTPFWSGAPNHVHVSPWLAEARACDVTAPVWCVED